MTGGTDGPAVQQGVGVPDALERLWTPHRMAYIKGEGKPPGDGRATAARSAGCPGCPTRTGLIVARGEIVYAVLNLYPYNAGHLMVCPYRHVADYTDLTAGGDRRAGRPSPSGR